MVSKYSRVVLRDDILASPLPNVISGAQAKQTTFHKHCYNSKMQWALGTKNCFVFVTIFFSPPKTLTDSNIYMAQNLIYQKYKYSIIKCSSNSLSVFTN